ncbi:MAG TPA: lysine N(6)-hydroxylase/L-ornithine N(5)-oxygenase family protein [Steroidobacter sp.]|nr:lysine N(6)-hydroxylase/L-ornithine N(5)-oxygenase family protein [Steroidobacter sp.]
MSHAASAHDTYDLIGIGFGPSNLALAIALDELSETHGRHLQTLFVEKQQSYRWHGGTLVDQSTLQISFLKDLVSLRNPTSPYSFVNYLHQHGRLVDFINMGTSYPCRMEYNDYLRWAAQNFASRVKYGEMALRIEPAHCGDDIDRLRLLTRDHKGYERSYETRGIVIGCGGTPHIPPLFAGLSSDPRVFHHSTYLSGISQLRARADGRVRVAIVGAGQSAAEAFIDLHERFPTSEVDLIFRASALKPADDSPFVNEIFAPDYVDLVFGQAAADREKFIDEYRNTNYAVIDRDLLEQMYGILYRLKVCNQRRHAMLARRRIEAAAATATGIQLTLVDIATGAEQTRLYDVVVLATGYQRRSHLDLLAPLREHLPDFAVDRSYRLRAAPTLTAPIFLQGFCESSHGLSDTLLSVLPIRAAEIGADIYRCLPDAAARDQLTQPASASA